MSPLTTFRKVGFQQFVELRIVKLDQFAFHRSHHRPWSPFVPQGRCWTALQDCCSSTHRKRGRRSAREQCLSMAERTFLRCVLQRRSGTSPGPYPPRETTPSCCIRYRLSAFPAGCVGAMSAPVMPMLAPRAPRAAVASTGCLRSASTRRISRRPLAQCRCR